MPKFSKSSKSDSEVIPRKYHAFNCRICKRPHPLRTCKKFLDMNMAQRLRAVRDNKYCVNCLAHDHSKGTCFSKHGCKHCHKHHHTLLHVNPRLAKDLLSRQSRSSSRSPSPGPSTSSKARESARSKSKSKPKDKGSSSSSSTLEKSVSFSSILRQNTIILLPTVQVKIGSTTSHARCLLDSGLQFSRVSKGFVEKLKLVSYTLEDETICQLILKSRFDSSSKIEGTFRVDDRVAIRTPSQSLPETYKKNFRDLYFADSQFYESAPIDIVIGVDLYPKVICQGVFSRAGFPTAQSTIFGWTIYGPCSL